MTHHPLCPVAQVPGKPEPCVCVQLETAERDALEAAVQRVHARLEEIRYLRVPDGESLIDGIKREVAVAILAGGHG